MIRKVALYARVSTISQDLAPQLIRLREVGASNRFRMRAQCLGNGTQQIIIFDGWQSDTALMTASVTRGGVMMPSSAGWIEAGSQC